MSKRIEVEDLNVYYSDFLAVEGVSIDIQPRTVTVAPMWRGRSAMRVV